MRLPKDLWRKYRKWWLIGGGISSGLILVAGFIIWSVVSWQSYERQYVTWHVTLKAKADDALVLPAKTVAEREKKLASLSALRTSAEEGGHNCGSYGLLHWQQFVPLVKQRMDNCRRVTEGVKQFGAALKLNIDYIVSERNMTKIMTTNITKKVEEAGVVQQPQYWSDVLKKLNAQTPSKQFESVIQLAKTKTTTLQQSWQALVAASEVKDRAKYETAIAQLTTTYESMREIADLSEKTFLPLAVATEKSYQQAFSQ